MKNSLKFSIRHRIMLIFIGLMAAMLVSIWAINNWWLERYYIGQKVKEMEQAYTDIDNAVMDKVLSGENIGDVISEEMADEWELWLKSAQSGTFRDDGQENSEPEGDSPDEGQPHRAPHHTRDETAGDEVYALPEGTLLGVIRDYAEKNNISIALIDSNTGKPLLGPGRDNDYLVQKAQRYLLGRGGRRAIRLKEHENYVVETTYDLRSKSSYMEGWGFLSDNSTQVIMSMPLASIRDSADLSNRFTTYVGLVALVSGSVLMYFVTRRVTKPILQLASLSERMSELDFDAKYEEDSGDEIGVLGRSMNTLSDKLKETIGELQEANSQLQHDIEEKIQIDEMRKEFIANVSHELKTPIALIQGYAEGLTEGMCEDEESRNYYCEVIMDEANKMNKMVKQLLTLTALEFGNDAPVMSSFDVTELISDVLSASSILIQQKQAHVEFERRDSLYVTADEFKIEEVLTNYLTNAMNHLDGEHIIRIAAGRKSDDTAIVRVFNSGSPIPEKDIPNLWTKFFKVDKARTRAYGGSGIGLSIVKAIMDAHHQQCGVENRDGGVEFWFTLAMSEEKE